MLEWGVGLRTFSRIYHVFFMEEEEMERRRRREKEE
jgi:hypothetical protein